jgi:hypothetical protein
VSGRARAHRASELLKKAAKKLAKLFDSIPDEYLDRALRRLGEQLDATKPMWDVNKKKMIDIPDEKIRQDAAAMILAYKWGKPVERSITAHADADDFEKVLEIARQVQARESLQKIVQGKEIPPALPCVAREDSQQAG